MAKLNFKKENSKFELEVGDITLKGILNDLTKEQKEAQDEVLKPFKDMNESVSKLVARIERLQAQLKTKTHLKDWVTVDKIETEIFELQDQIKTKQDGLRENYDPESMFRDRISNSVVSTDIDAILEAGREHGYQNVFNTILQDIQEQNEKK